MEKALEGTTGREVTATQAAAEKDAAAAARNAYLLPQIHHYFCAGCQAEGVLVCADGRRSAHFSHLKGTMSGFEEQRVRSSGWKSRPGKA